MTMVSSGSPSSPPSATARLTSQKRTLISSQPFTQGFSGPRGLPVLPDAPHLPTSPLHTPRPPACPAFTWASPSWTLARAHGPMSSSSPPPAPPLAPDLTRKTKSNSLHALLWLPSRQGLSRHGSVWGGKTLCFRVSPRENKGSPAWQQPPRRPGPGLDLVQHHSPALGPCPPSILSTVFLSLDQNQHLGQSSS